MKKANIGFFGGLGTLGKETLLELQKVDVNSNIYVFYKEGQNKALSKDFKRISFVSFKSVDDFTSLFRKINLDIVIDLVGSYSFGKIDTIASDRIRKLVDGNFTFHANLIATYFKGKKYPKKMVIVTSSTVGKINPDQPLYGSLKTALSQLIKSVNAGLENGNKIIEFKPGPFKSDIFRKSNSNIPKDMYLTFKDPVAYARKIVRLICKQII